MMRDGERVVALIPARGGSMRLPGKNMKRVGGRTLIERAVSVALSVRTIDEVVVSSDSQQILTDAEQAGAIAEQRPASLARDDTTSREVIDDLLDRRGDIDVIILLQPTSPLREPADIEGCIDLLHDHPAVVTVVPTDHPTSWTTMVVDGRIRPLAHRHVPGPPHGMEVRPNGAVYVARADYLRSGYPLVGEQTAALVMPRSRSIDVDDGFDLHLARLLAAHPYSESG